MSVSRFAYPEKLRFECTRCGDCCRGWQVMLGPSDLERLNALDWQGRADDLAAENIVERVQSRTVLARREDGACVFLGAENQCRIHEHFGGEKKPLMCRLYPFGFLPVGDRIAVDISFACRSIAEGTGSPLKRRIPEWSKLLGEKQTVSREHRFSRKYKIEGELLWELEHQLLELVADPSMSILDRLRAVAEFMRLATTSDPRTEAARTLRQVMAKGIPAQIKLRPAEGEMDKTQRAIFFHLLFLMLNPTPPELARASGKTRQKEVKRRVQAADGYKFAKAHPWVDNREVEKGYGDVASVGPGYLASSAGSVLVERYFEAKIVGQRFMREGEEELPFVDAVPRLLLLYPMLLWTAKALAAERGERETGEPDARHALRLLDRSYGEVRLSELAPKQRKAWQFVLMETDLPTCATLDMLRVVS